MTAKGTVSRSAVCNMEIWCECFGNNPAALKKSDSYEISAIMHKMDSWKKAPRTIFPIYGRQRGYIRDKNKRGVDSDGAGPSIVTASNS